MGVDAAALFADAGWMVSQVAPAEPFGRAIWTAAEAWAWYDRQPWLVGANFVPSTAVNQLEMWQADTFDAATIARELGWAAEIGMNTVRVFLHDLLWQDDAPGLVSRIDRFLGIADNCGIQTMLVLFDSCWNPSPRSGPQPAPVPGVHNSRWVQSPGRAVLENAAEHPRLRAYVEGVVEAFATDRRVLAWDIWNEPDSPEGTSYPNHEGKSLEVEALIEPAFSWARSRSPVQPLTSGLFQGGDWRPGCTTSLETCQLAQSDIISFHDYRWPESFANRVEELRGHGRPIIATEYLARGAGSTFDGVLPVAKALGVGALNWGLVDGKLQTRLPWDSWVEPYVGRVPLLWFHDVLSANGEPYRAAEVDLIRRLAGSPKTIVPPSPPYRPIDAQAAMHGKGSGRGRRSSESLSRHSTR